MNESNNKTVTFKVTLSEKDRDRYKQKCKEAGTTMSADCRAFILEQIKD